MRDSIPSIDAKDNFANSFPLAKDVRWEKYSDVTDTQNPKTNYKVAFVANAKMNWITYSEKGDIIEERQEIAIDQLPQNIYNAVKEKYPEYKIAAVSTYKHSHKDGSYAILLKPLSSSNVNGTEVIFRENASQVI